MSYRRRRLMNCVQRMRTSMQGTRTSMQETSYRRRRLMNCVQRMRTSMQGTRTSMQETSYRRRRLGTRRSGSQKNEIEFIKARGYTEKCLESPKYLFFTDDIVVDWDTAHPYLSIAGDKKSFTYQSQVQKVTLHEGSFDSSVCVLGSEGFSSGKHYWEVDVGKCSDWDLGVARKSAPRKGRITLSPKEGFWALGLSVKFCWARTDPWTQLEVQENPRKVGVFLNCEEKTLTFFNVTNMSVMFTFQDCAFSEAVYPFFKNSHRESTIRICSVEEE
ncbi:butyrophilin subfamily 1 member A1-like isoform X10 [Falco rusticolus]|uniref:butyrophilin subfamily 1 member A1-like isoform X10 n=1 Tax=Falco rusticolus TaxID=120794 RepID=UPI00188679A3|nr:butyrophilin subfamily 1 member A1-like isoform X10 [Falco rusticolus]